MKTSRFIWRIFLVPLVTMLCAFFVAPLQTQGQSVEAYVQMSADKTTLTFFYDTKRASREGTTWDIEEKKEGNERQYPAWTGTYNNPNSTTTKAVVDASFANFHPTSTASWFQYLKALTNIEGLQYLNTSEVTDMSGMFSACSILTNLDLSNLNTEKTEYMNEIFYGCSSLTSLDLSNFNTSNVTDMSNMFYRCSALLSLDLKSFNTSKVENMNGMFYECSALTSLDLSNFNTSKVENMNGMFADCSDLISLNLKSFNTEKTKDMSQMFARCSALTSLDLSNFNTEKTKNMTAMFSDCSSLTSLDLSNFNTENVTNMAGMFYGCASLKTLDLSSFNTSNVTTMGYMFYGCASLKTLDLSSFNTEKVTETPWMFASCSLLVKIVNNKTWNCKHSPDMFLTCTALKGAVAYDANKTDVTMANPETGYFTKTKPTAVLPVLAPARENGIYTLQGKRVSGSFQHLPSSVYIVNGKKVVVQ